MKKILTILFLFATANLFATNLWYKATTGTSWGTADNWYEDASWTIAHSAIPLATDSVQFISGAGNCASAAGMVCLSANFTGYNGTLSGTNAWAISGQLTAAGTWSYTGTITFNSTSTGWKITTNGKNIFSTVFNGSGGGWTLMDNLTTTNGGDITISNGTFDANNKNISTGTITISGGTVTGGTGTWKTLVSNSGTRINITGGTCDFTGTTIEIVAGTTSGTRTYRLNELTFSNITVRASTSTGIVLFSYGFTVTGTLTIVAPNKIQVTAGKTIALGSSATVSISGTAGNLVELKSSSASTFGFTKSSGTISVDYMDLYYCAASGGATFNPGCNSTNSGGNTGWVWCGGNPFFWSDF